MILVLSQAVHHPCQHFITIYMKALHCRRFVCFSLQQTWSWKAEITLSLHFKGFPSSGEVGPVTGSLMGRRPLVDFNCTWRVDAGQQIYPRLEEVLRHLASEWIEETKHERWLWAETVWVSVSQLETGLCFRLLLDIRFTQSGWFNFTFSHQQRAAEDRRHTGSWWTLSLCELLVELFTKEMFHLVYLVYEKVVSTTNVWRTGALLPQTERLFCHFKKFKRSETNTAVLASSTTLYFYCTTFIRQLQLLSNFINMQHRFITPDRIFKVIKMSSFFICFNIKAMN